MEEQHRALIVILVLSTAFFMIARRPLAGIMARDDFIRRRNLWFGLTLAAFLAQNYWIYLIIASSLLLFAKRIESNATGMYLFILFAVPSATYLVPAAGLLNYLFEISHPRMLALFILLPAFLALLGNPNIIRFGRLPADKILAAYVLLDVILYVRGSTVTDGLRHAFYVFLELFLPYFVMSRSLNNLKLFKDSMQSLVLAVMILALIGVFEFFKGWLLYRPVLESLDLQGGMTRYLGRDGMLRVSTSVGHPIALGYLMAVGIGFYLFLQRSYRRKKHLRIGMALLVAGLVVPLSRGPWVGATVLIFVFVATGRSPIRRLIVLAIAGSFSLLLISALPGGERIINMLPYIGTTEHENVKYREQLFNNSMVVIQRNPWFGSVDFQNTPEMDELRAGAGGIIDIVNSYLRIALEKGLVGLGLFVSFFALVLRNIRRAMRSIPDQESEEYLLGRSLLATLMAILVIIVTVSSITIIPIVYWSVAGLGIAYSQMIFKQSGNDTSMGPARKTAGPMTPASTRPQ